MTVDVGTRIQGRFAHEIAASVRGLVDRGELSPGDALPPVRSLAAALGVNRNTVTAAYRQLGTSGVVVTDGRRGTRVHRATPPTLEGFAGDTVLHDIASGNPDPALIPDPTPVLARVAHRPVLYGEPVIDPGLEEWAARWMRDDLAPTDVALTVTSGASDAIERLLTSLARDDAVAIEAPGFLSSIHAVRTGGFRALPVPVDDEGMTVDGVRAALDEGARAIIITPRAQNPTGASLTARRAAAIREVLRAHPFVLVIEDDHFSMLATSTLYSVIGGDHRRWARIRSVSNMLGPDMCLAITASDPETHARLATRLTPGTTWVSHLLQRLTHAQLTDPNTLAQIQRAAEHYAERNSRFRALLAARGIRAPEGDGLSVWVPVGAPAPEVSAGLMRRGWLVRTGESFAVGALAVADHVRLTIHALDDARATRLADDLAAAIDAAGGSRHPSSTALSTSHNTALSTSHITSSASPLTEWDAS